VVTNKFNELRHKTQCSLPRLWAAAEECDSPLMKRRPRKKGGQYTHQFVALERLNPNRVTQCSAPGLALTGAFRDNAWHFFPSLSEYSLS
jgi:hypothetical protein